jgi:enoyl-CoA hydratase/carnithine racemase
MNPVLYGDGDGVARITLNRPTQLNAINEALSVALLAALDRAIADPLVEIIRLDAAGRSFCAGDDLAELAAKPFNPAEAAGFIDRLQDITRRIMLAEKPVVCVAQGWIVGAAVAWLLNADIAIVAEDAALFCPEARHGLFPTGGVSLLLGERCGPALAADILWLGSRIDAAEMRVRGIVTHVVPSARLVADADALLGDLMALPAASRRRLKRARIGVVADRLEAALAFERDACIEAVADPALRRRIATVL